MRQGCRPFTKFAALWWLTSPIFALTGQSHAGQQLLSPDEDGAYHGYPARPAINTFESYDRPTINIWTASDFEDRIRRPRNKTLLPLAFEPLPLGSIKPVGWLRDQLELMANGLPGRMHEFYRLVRDAPWLDGDSEYSPLNEAFPYWFNGVVPLAFGTDDQRLKEVVLAAAEQIVAHQSNDGWLGPEEDVRQRNFWGRYPLFLGLAQLADVEPQMSSRVAIVIAMHKFVDVMHSMLSDGHQGYVWKPGDQFDEQWGRSRAADMIMALQWLYEKYPRGNEEKIHHCMMYLYEKAYDWSQWFSEDQYIRDDVDTFPTDVTNSLFPFLHGVNAGQGLKAGAVMRRLVHDDSLVNSTRNGVNWTFQYHGTPSGAIIGDERQSGLSPVRGTELCSVVETMFSLSYLYHALGDRDFAERAEMAAYNALPVMVMPGWWAHQYIAQTNQPVSHRLSKTPFWNVGPLGQTFGTEPNYPCCTVDFPQGYPKFVSATFVREGLDGIAHALLGPAEVRTKTKNGHHVHIRCKTNYPFSHRLEYHIKAKGPLQFSFRIPSWAILDESHVWLNGRPIDVQPDPLTGLQRIFLRKGSHRIEAEFGARIRVEQRANNTVSIYHGALLYAIPVYGDYYADRPARYPGQTAPPEANDWTIIPRTPWNLAIDPSTATFFEYLNREAEFLPNPIWQDDGPPVSISVMACEIDWKLTEDGYAPNPPHIGQRNCTGRAVVIEMKPYGSAKLHMAELPTVDLSPGSPDLWDPFGHDVATEEKAQSQLA